MAAADSRPLTGVRALVTRPATRARALAQRIELAGGQAICFPTLEIAAAGDVAALERVLADIARFDLAVFISPNAVRHGLAYVHARGGPPARLRIAAIGHGTAAELAKAGVANAIVPAEGSDSEALLTRPELQQVAGQRIVIFRGDGGRKLLGDTLRARGAQVEYAECYRRVRPDTDATPLNARLRANGIDIVTVTSVENLRNLHDMLDDDARARLQRLPIVVVGARQAEACQTLGIRTKPWIARDAGDDAIVAAIQAWRAGQNSL